MPEEKKKGVQFDELNGDGLKPDGVTHLLLIAIDEYANAPLNNCVAGADRLFDALIRHYQSFDPANVKKLYNEDATCTAIDQALKSYMDPEKLSPNDSLIIFFSGHGVNDGEAHYLVAYDKNYDKWGVYYPVSTLITRLDQIPSFHIVLLMDSCFSGGMFDQTTKEYKQQNLGAFKYKSRWGMAASHTREVAYDGKIGEESPFASALIDVLERKVGSFSIQELGIEVKNIVRENTHPEQTPICWRLPIQTNNDLGEYFFIPDPEKLNEDEFWAACRQDNNTEAFQRYLATYPRGKYFDAALEYMNILIKGLDPPPPPDFLFYKDPRDGQTYRTVIYNGQEWLAQNLNFKLEKGCWFYKNNQICETRYGRLYTWEAARKACPPGWRLPTDEEWKILIKKHGGDVRAYNEIVEGGNSGFNGQAGGYRTKGAFVHLGEAGYYWSGTESEDVEEAWSYYFFRNHRKIIRYNNLKSWAFSCRCVRDKKNDSSF